MAKAGFNNLATALDLGKDKVCVFRVGQYLRGTGRVDDSYPKPIANNWPDLDRGGLARGIDAAIN